MNTSDHNLTKEVYFGGSQVTESAWSKYWEARITMAYEKSELVSKDKSNSVY